MDHKAKAKAAWERSLEVVGLSSAMSHQYQSKKNLHKNPSEWPAHLLLGLEAINASKNPAHPEEERTRSYAIGTKYIEKAFNANNRNAAAANALCDFFLRKGDQKRVCLRY